MASIEKASSWGRPSYLVRWRADGRRRARAFRSWIDAYRFVDDAHADEQEPTLSTAVSKHWCAGYAAGRYGVSEPIPEGPLWARLEWRRGARAGIARGFPEDAEARASDHASASR